MATDHDNPTVTPVRDLGEVTLRNGERMAVRIVTPVAPDDIERLTVFLDHKPDTVVRKIRRQLGGDAVVLRQA